MREYTTGVFSKNLIKEGSFICEYKVPKKMPPYPRKLRPAMEEEYEWSGEGCFILEAQDKSGKWWCFDATRRLNQYGGTLIMHQVAWQMLHRYRP